MKKLIVTFAAAVTLTATPAFAGLAQERAAEQDRSDQVVAALRTDEQGAGAASYSGQDARAAEDAVLPSGSALGQGPASVNGGVPDGTHRPAIGAGGVVSED